MDSKCSGRRQCDVEVKDSSFKSYVPCHKDLKSYLEASFNCIQGIYLVHFTFKNVMRKKRAFKKIPFHDRTNQNICEKLSN